MTLVFTATVSDDEGNETEISLPGKHAVCGNCEGHGSHLRPGMREHAYTREEFDEAFHDEEDRAAYFERGGVYDVTCETCGGRRVVVVADEARCSAAELAELERWRQQDERRRREDAEDARTMRRECGQW